MNRAECVIDGCTNERVPGKCASRCREHIAAAYIQQAELAEGDVGGEQA